MSTYERELRQLGLRVRELRRLQGMTTRDLASASGVSTSMINQIETAKAKPSVTSLRKIAAALGQPLAVFFVDETGALDGLRPAPAGATPGRSEAARPAAAGEKRVEVVRKHERRRLHLPQSHLVYELLTPNLRWDIEFLVVQLEPDHPPVESMAHPGQECALVIQGVMHVIVGNEEFVLEAGDSITLDSSIPHRIENRGTETVIQISAITPPSL